MAENSINFRVDPDLKEAFEAMCKERDMTVSQVIRRFMRSEVKTWAVLDNRNHLPVYRKILNSGES